MVLYLVGQTMMSVNRAYIYVQLVRCIYLYVVEHRMQQVERRRLQTLLCLQVVASRCGGSHFHSMAKFQIEWCPPHNRWRCSADRGMCSLPLE